MAARGSGHIVFISSLAGKAASPGATLYCATKFGLRGASLSMRQDLESKGVGVSVICPGFVSDAGMFADSGATVPKGVGTVTTQQVADATIKAIESNRAEIDVAPIGLKLGATVAQVAPQLAARAQKASGGHKLAHKMSKSQSAKR
jgi:short-subunit dehydrogenase